MRAPVDRIPVSLLTGFLGSGKTTLLNHWVHLPEMAGVAVLVNEFGDVGVDHHLVDKLDENTVLLESGCLCCAIQGDLVGALKSLASRASRREVAPITRVVIETTGLADPVPVIYTLMEDAFVSARYVCDGVVTVVSATHGQTQLREFPEAVRQVVAADLLFITKCDRASSSMQTALQAALRELNPGAPQQMVRDGCHDAQTLLACGVYSPTSKRPALAQWLGEEALHQARLLSGATQGATTKDAAAEAADTRDAGRPLGERWRQQRDTQRQKAARTSAPHTPGVSSFVVTFDHPVAWFGFAVGLGQVLSRHGAQLLRVKGLIKVAGVSRPQVIQCVQGVAYPSVSLAAWPKEGPFQDGRGRLVFIARHLDAEQVDAIARTLAQLPGDAVALRMSAGDRVLPTRCWLAQRMPVSAPNAIELDGWVVQAKRFRGASSLS